MLLQSRGLVGQCWTTQMLAYPEGLAPSCRVQQVVQDGSTPVKHSLNLLVHNHLGMCHLRVVVFALLHAVLCYITVMRRALTTSGASASACSATIATAIVVFAAGRWPRDDTVIILYTGAYVPTYDMLWALLGMWAQLDACRPCCVYGGLVLHSDNFPFNRGTSVHHYIVCTKS